MSQTGSGPKRPDDRILVRGARQLITLQGPQRMRRGKELREIGLLRDASVLVEGGIITEVGSARRLENLEHSSGARFVDARGMVAVPAFVDSLGDLLPVFAEEETGQPTGGAGTQPEGSPYSHAAMNTVAKRLERALRRLADLGTLYAQFRLRFPDQGLVRSRLLRNLLQMDMPQHSFRAVLHATGIAGRPESASLPECLPRAARNYWKELEGSLSVAVPCSALRGMSREARTQAFSGIRSSGRTAVLVTRPGLLPPAELLDLAVSHAATILGTLPSDPGARIAFARFGVPWIVLGNSYLFDEQSGFTHLKQCIREGMSLALASAFDVNAPGSASLPDLLTVFRQRGGVFLEELLQLTITNNAFAAGVGNRMGTIETGKEANILLLDCEDYREMGIHLGLPRLAAIIRRGELLRCDARIHR